MHVLFGLRRRKKKTKKILREERYLGKEESFICNTSAGRIFQADRYTILQTKLNAKAKIACFHFSSLKKLVPHLAKF